MSRLPHHPVRRGLVGIERQIEKDKDVTNKKISQAFQDIHSLMETAKPMVELIHKISDIMKVRPILDNECWEKVFSSVTIYMCLRKCKEKMYLKMKSRISVSIC